MTTTGYEPLDTLKPVAEGIWIIDGPAHPRGPVPYPTRAVVVQLSPGQLWVYSPTRLTDTLRDDLRMFGEVAHLIVPNADHGAYLEPWAAAFPDAQIWHTEGDDRGTRALRSDGAEADWGEVLDQLVVRSGPDRREAVFFHRASRSLIIADLFERMETRFLPPRARPFVWLAGTDSDGGHMRPTHRWALRGPDKTALAEDVEVLIKWGPRRILLSHGLCVDHSAADELERVFRKVLRPYRWEAAYDEHQDTSQR